MCAIYLGWVDRLQPPAGTFNFLMLAAPRLKILKEIIPPPPPCISYALEPP